MDVWTIDPMRVIASVARPFRSACTSPHPPSTPPPPLSACKGRLRLRVTARLGRPGISALSSSSRRSQFVAGARRRLSRRHARPEHRPHADGLSASRLRARLLLAQEPLLLPMIGLRIGTRDGCLPRIMRAGAAASDRRPRATSYAQSPLPSPRESVCTARREAGRTLPWPGPGPQRAEDANRHVKLVVPRPAGNRPRGGAGWAIPSFPRSLSPSAAACVCGPLTPTLTDRTLLRKQAALASPS